MLSAPSRSTVVAPLAPPVIKFSRRQHVITERTNGDMTVLRDGAESTWWRKEFPGTHIPPPRTAYPAIFRRRVRFSGTHIPYSRQSRPSRSQLKMGIFRWRYADIWPSSRRQHFITGGANGAMTVLRDGAKSIFSPYNGHFLVTVL